MTITHRIRRHERGLLYRYGDLRAVLPAGTYRLFSRLVSARRDRIETVSTLDPIVRHANLDELIESPAFRAATTIVELADAERALVWKDGRLVSILGPGRHALWTPNGNEATRLRVERHSLAEPRLDHPNLEAIAAHPDASRWLEEVNVDSTDEAIVLLNGRVLERLRGGKHLYWRGAGRLVRRTADLREKVLDVAGQELLTLDKVTVRTNLFVVWQVTDALTALTRTESVETAIYREAQMALRASVGSRTLDALLAEKSALNEEIGAALAARSAELGVAIRSVGARDVILPGDLRELYAKVIAAEKEAQANLIRRREETAAARSQANTARLLAEQPALLRLRELEALESVLKGASITLVAGQGDLSTQLRALMTS
jgi:regulator of protease activity HflC (stomatin/prohibitin superfamily)